MTKKKRKARRSLEAAVHKPGREKQKPAAVKQTAPAVEQKTGSADQKPRAVEQIPGAAEQLPQTAEQEQETTKKKDVFICCVIFLFTLVVYILTLAPTVYFGDSGELTAAAYNLGIAHPPGYPLYLLLGKLFMLLAPLGDMAARMNLLSAFFAALTAVLLYLISRMLNRGRFISTAVTVMAAFSFTFWTQAVIAEVYTLAAFFFCLLILSTLLWLKSRENRWLLLLTLTAGFALTHHVIIAVYYPVFFIFILVNKPRLLKDWKLVVKSACLFLLPLLLYLYLPLRSAAEPLNDWGNPETFSAVFNHITAGQFTGMFLKYGLDGVWFQAGVFFAALFKQFPFVLLLLAAAGIIFGVKKERKKTIFFLVLMAVNITYSWAYFITDIEAHFIPFFLLLVLFMGGAFQSLYLLLQKTDKKPLLRLAAIFLVVVALLPLVFNWTKCNRSGSYLARNYGQNMLDSLDKKGILFIDGETELFLAAYLKIAAGLRPDVEVYDLRQNIFFIPAKKEKGEKVTTADLFGFAQKVVAEKRPVYFTNPVFGNFKYAEYGVLFRVLGGEENPGSIEYPWEKYDLSGLDGPLPDADSKETAGKYFLSRAKYLARQQAAAAASADPGKGSAPAAGEGAGKQTESAAAEDPGKGAAPAPAAGTGNANQDSSLAGGADEFLEKALAAAGDRHYILKHAAIFFMQSGRRDQAERLIRKAISIYPFDSDDYNMLGMIVHYRLEYKEALMNYDKALQLRANSISALMNRAMLFNQMGDREKRSQQKVAYYQKAFRDLERARKIEPKNPSIAAMMNRVYRKLSR